MSKQVKQLMIDDLKRRWDGVEEAITVEMARVEANDCVALRKRLREKSIHVMVVKNSLARRASEGTSLAPAFEGTDGAMAVVWGGEDIVDLAKEVTALADDKEYEEFKASGGVLDGAKLSADEVKAVSKWPTRTEMLSTLMGQVMGPAMTLSAQLLGPAKQLASQVKQKSEGDEE
ncbi:50S ribosomal protein L10 [Pseudobythopirellula maris]|uniref:Large ribosomal subunit protein uL10 n=1 Tax=Pseudobythopirellula maris TaxID=2527991 RepID=A0A5C5ZL66_9BACT|nr:50S ribosomal protein L10 [Pseudobythopirellula maris]TWT88139.1 50S ribosomal protein L10 [Pseudobythopirellula maris]